MPPKKTTTAAKPAAKPKATGAKGTTASKGATAKGATTSKGATAKAGTSGAAKTPAAAAKEPAKVVKRETMEIGLKQVKPMLCDLPDTEIVKSGKLPLLIDPDERALTFLRYTDSTAVIEVLNTGAMAPETLRQALMYSLRYGTTIVFDMGEADLTNALKARWDEVEPGLWGKIMDRSILKPDNFKSLIRDTDKEDMQQEIYFLEETLNKSRCILFTKNMEPTDHLRDNFYCVFVKPN